MFQKLYNWMMSFAGKRRAVVAMSAISFAESSFFPLPPDPLYVAVLLARPKDAWRLAMICTLSSVIGGFLGYYIGYALYETLGQMIIDTYDLHQAFAKFQAGFDKWGFWIVALKGLTPIPYKVVTIFSGVAKLDLFVFGAASLIARGFRFYLLAALIRYAGPTTREYIERNMGLMTSLVLGAIVAGFLILKYL